MDRQSEVTPQPAHTVSSDGDSGCALDEYTWVPPGLTAQQVSTWLLFIKLQYYINLYDKKPPCNCLIFFRWKLTLIGDI